MKNQKPPLDSKHLTGQAKFVSPFVIRLISFSFVLFVLLLGSGGSARAQVIFEDNFESYENNSEFENTGNWGSGNSVYLETDLLECDSGTKCVRIDYAGGGYGPYVLQHSVSSNHLSEMYLRFYFKVRKEGSGVPEGGIKFCKWFGTLKEDPTSYANSTFNLGEVTNDPVRMNGVCYGEGDALQNDTQAYIWLTGSKKDGNVVVEESSDYFYPEENIWYCVEIYMKYNTDDNRDGAYSIWIDGVLKLSATNVKNRHNDNIREFSRIAFGDYANQYVNGWSIWYDDIVFSDEYIGPLTGDTTPPSRSNPQPTGTLSSGTTSTTISLDTNETAVCKYSAVANIDYDNMSNIFAMTNSTNHSTNITNLEDGNSYTYYIRCQDESNNQNTDDFEISFSISTHTLYNISNFINLVSDWLKTESGLESDVNGDGVVNTRDLGIMMSNWQ